MILKYCLSGLLLFCFFLNAQVGINTTTPRNTAVLELESRFPNGDYGALMLPRVTETQLSLLTSRLTSNDEGMIIYVTDSRTLKIWNGEALRWDIVFTFNNSIPEANSVTISGTFRVGETLNANYSYFDADGDPEGTPIIQWYTADDGSGLNLSPILGANTINYVLQPSDLGKFIGVGIQAVALRGNSPGNESIHISNTTVEQEIVVWINEIHYNNSGGDVNEGVEIAGIANTDLTNYTLVLYNGSDNQVYNTLNLNGVIPNQMNNFGTLFFPISGIQNGNPDGIALVDAAGDIVQFLSYGGEIIANGGPANGLTSIDIGVMETDTTLIGTSIQLQGTGNRFNDFIWGIGITASSGNINTGQIFN